MKVLVVHPQFRVLGGAERVALHILSALEKLGLEPHVLTTDAFDAERATAHYGESCVLKRTRWFVETRPAWVLNNRVSFSRLRQAVLQRHAYRMSGDYRYSFSTYNEMAFQGAGFQYIHHPFWAPYQLLTRHHLFATKRVWWKGQLADMAYNAVLPAVSGTDPRAFSDNFTAVNSVFIKSVVDSWLGVDARVLYPGMLNTIRPVDSTRRRDCFLLIGRFGPDKKWIEFLPYLVALHQAFPDLPFVFAGTHATSSYAASLKKQVQDAGLPVEWHEDAPREKIDELLSTCRFWINPKPFEHFGITTVEAVEAGAIPLVFDNGGSIEIVPEPACQFRDANSLVSAVRFLLQNPQEAASILLRLRKGLERFTTGAFKVNLQKTIQDFLASA